MTTPRARVSVVCIHTHTATRVSIDPPSRFYAFALRAAATARLAPAALLGYVGMSL